MVTIIKLYDFMTKLKTGMEYVGREKGWNMDLKRAGWVCPTSRIKRHYGQDTGTKVPYSGKFWLTPSWIS